MLVSGNRNFFLMQGLSVNPEIYPKATNKRGKIPSKSKFWYDIVKTENTKFADNEGSLYSYLKNKF